jgi:Tfp pilus assembly protein PilZ
MRSLMPSTRAEEKRRAGGAIRVPFVRRCWIDYSNGERRSAFVVNINVLGAYVAEDEIPPLGERVVFRFQAPGSELEVVLDGVVAWRNPQQEHPVHSLPAGFGIAFHAMSDRSRERIEQVVIDYLERQSRPS